MNALEQPLKQGHEKRIVNAPLTSRAPSSTPGQVRTQSARTKHGESLALAFVVFLSAIVFLIHFLRSRIGEFPLPPEEFDGLGVVACALAYVALFLWRLSRAFKRDAQQFEDPKTIQRSSPIEREMNPGK